MRARLNCFSDTRENLARDEDAMTGKDSRRIRERISVKRGATRDEPPRLDKPPLSVDPVGRTDPALGRKELGRSRKRSIKPRVGGRRRLGGEQCDAPRAG